MSKETIQLAIEAVRELIGDRLSTGSSVLELHSHDEAYTTPALPDAVAFPETTEEVSAILKICNQHHCPVVPFGIGTSLEGHIVPIKGGISVDTSHMKSVLKVNDRDWDAIVEPGVTRKELNQALKGTGLMFTVDPGADATIGGMTATRASGTNTVRYGSMKDNVLALEVVLADGSIINTGTRARKSAAGYDLTHLMIGSEGTLGIITKVTVKLDPVPETISAATCAFESIADGVDTVIMAMQVGIPMARIELLDELQMQGMNLYNPEMKLPEKPHLFLEFHGTETGVAEQVALFDKVSQEFNASNFAWASKTEDRNKLWKARHSAYYAGKALRKGSEGVVTDCCAPLSNLAECIERTKVLIEDSGMIAPLVGHVGDGNFHLLILVDPDNQEEIQQAMNLAGKVSHLAIELGGTVTGEHGVGTGKIKYMQEEHGDAYALMGLIKKTLDPNNIMNPGKLVEV